MTYLRHALWAALAGAFIPVMAVLNARLGRTLGEPLHAAFVLFAVGFVATGVACVAFTGSLPGPAVLRLVSPVNFAGGTIVAFYVMSITILVPRFGVGNAVLFVMIGQIATSAAIDHVGLAGATIRPMSALRAAGLAMLLAGLVVTQVSGERRVPSE